MTLCFTCVACSTTFEQSFRRVVFDDREGSAPLRYSDRESVMTCPSCGADAVFNESATIRLGTPSKKTSILEWAERDGAKIIDLNAAAGPSARRRQGVHRIAPGYPGREGGESGREI